MRFIESSQQRVFVAITIPCSATFLLELGARILLNVANKGSFRGKKTLKIYIFRLFF